jgi:hypothetical protein
LSFAACAEQGLDIGENPETQMSMTVHEFEKLAGLLLGRLPMTISFSPQSSFAQLTPLRGRTKAKRLIGPSLFHHTFLKRVQCGDHRLYISADDVKRSHQNSVFEQKFISNSSVPFPTNPFSWEKKPIQRRESW